MALGSCDFAYIRVHRRTGKHRILDEGEIKSWGERLRFTKLQSKIRGPIYFMWGTDHEDQPIINSKNLTKELGTLAYNWKDKISNTGMLRFCSKVTQEARARKTVFEKEDCGDESTPASAKEVKEGEAVGTKTDLLHKTDELDQSDKSSPSSHGKTSKITSSSSAKKRTSSSGLISPKKKQASAGMKTTISTPNKQKMISDFFKK